MKKRQFERPCCAGAAVRAAGPTSSRAFTCLLWRRQPKKKVAHLSTMTSDMAHAPSKVEKATDPTTDDVDAVEEEEVTSFRELGVIEPICEACEKMNFSKPTPIQAKSIPVALQGRDVIGLAQTGSGKTAAFSIPILQALWDDPKPYFACILAPTRYVPFALITVNCPIRSRNKLKR